MIYNYHTHTHLCGHACGSEEEYVIRAIDGGIKYMGFSDHAPLKLSDGSESGYRVFISDVKQYVDTVRDLREKYKDKIDIKIGFEMEYYPELFDAMLRDAVSYGAEYLILGQHFLYADYAYSGNVGDDESLLALYVDRVIGAMESGAFSYVAHPDITRFSGNPEIYEKERRRLCEASRKTGIPLEINFLSSIQSQ